MIEHINKNRKQLLAVLPVKEYNVQLAGISTSILEGGDGPPIILLHGPGENATWWMRVIPNLVTTHRVVVPDLPGHAASKVSGGSVDADHVLPWLDALIKHTCSVPPVLVGHVLGGAIAARFAITHGTSIRQLVLVDSLGLGRFKPSLRFAIGLFRFMMKPSEKNYNRFLPHCMYDIGDLESNMGKLWKPFVTYNLDCAQDKDQQAALKTLMKQLGMPKISSEDLARIQVPVALIWGRHDQANQLKIAEAASGRFGWPLYVIEDSGDDPKLEKPGSFLDALRAILESGVPDPESSEQRTATQQESRSIRGWNG